jgi:GH18 family chitinase
MCAQDSTVGFLLRSGAAADKIVIGIPTYGRSYKLGNANLTHIGSPAAGPADPGPATREKGYLSYFEVSVAVKTLKLITKRVLRFATK